MTTLAVVKTSLTSSQKKKQFKSREFWQIDPSTRRHFAMKMTKFTDSGEALEKSSLIKLSTFI